LGFRVLGLGVEGEGMPLNPEPRTRMQVQGADAEAAVEREFFIDNLLARVHFFIVMIRWTGAMGVLNPLFHVALHLPS